MTVANGRATRRDFMAALGAGGLSVLGKVGVSSASVQGSAANAPTDARRRIDVHHHILPPEYVRLVGAIFPLGRGTPSGTLPTWDVAASLRLMDERAISAAIVSVSAPGLWFNDVPFAQRLARSCNEFAAQTSADHPTRFGFFASLPLPDVKASITELTHAVERLQCDGVVLMTNYGNRYLGDQEFRSLFDELNQRRVVVFVHPTVCDCDLDVLPGFAPPIIEFPHSTTRAVVSLLNSDTFARCPNIRFIFAHAGGTIPLLAKRITRAKPEWRNMLQRLYYDTASSADAAVFSSLLKLVTSKEILLGTDFPFAPPESVRANLDDLQTLGLSDAELRDIDRRNAAGLFPRFAG